MQVNRLSKGGAWSGQPTDVLTREPQRCYYFCSNSKWEAAVFLEINGYRLNASEADAVVQTLALAAGAMKEADYSVWLKANSKKA